MYIIYHQIWELNNSSENNISKCVLTNFQNVQPMPLNLFQGEPRNYLQVYIIRIAYFNVVKTRSPPREKGTKT